jgi:hypothetical protein
MVRYEQDYVYSSGIDYYSEGKGLIDIRLCCCCHQQIRYPIPPSAFVGPPLLVLSPTNSAFVCVVTNKSGIPPPSAFVGVVTNKSGIPFRLCLCCHQQVRYPIS